MAIDIDLITWHTERCLPHKPAHFISTRTAVSNESLQWIYDTLHGRFALVELTAADSLHSLIDSNLVPAFEDPSEATFYELTWS